MTRVLAGVGFVGSDAKLGDRRVVSRVLVRDVVEVGSIDATWPERLFEVLGARLQGLLDDLDG